jgi:RNA ligase
MSGQNRIVVDYGDYEGLVLLGAFNTKTGDEIPYIELRSLERFEIVKKYDGIHDHSELKDKVERNAEGFVVRFSNGDRIKIKGEEYVRLHKIMTNLSTRNVWETLANGEDFMASLVDVPDEFHAKIKIYVDELTSQFKTIENEYTWIFNTILKTLDTQNVPKENYRATFAQYALQYKHPAILFTMLDKRNYNKTIWDLIYPEYRKL